MKTKILAASVAALALSQPVSAGQWSVGLLAGQSSTDIVTEVCDDIRGTQTVPEPRAPNGRFIVNVNCEPSDSDTALGINLGYHFNQTWGLELGYMDLGEYEANINRSSPDPRVRIVNPNQQLTASFTALYFAGTATIPLGDKFSLTARLGLASIEAEFDASAATVSADSVDESAAMGGISLNYDFNDKFGAQLRYDLFEIDGTPDAATIGLNYRF